MMATILLLQTERIGGELMGIVIPAAVLLVSFFLTWKLYKKFSDK